VIEGLQNVLSTGDRKGYIYLIPQDKQELKVKVKYHIVTTTSDVTKSSIESTVRIPKLTDEDPILRGNIPYALNITLSGVSN
jgi:hypothetical protein